MECLLDVHIDVEPFSCFLAAMYNQVLSILCSYHEHHQGAVSGAVKDQVTKHQHHSMSSTE